MQRADLISRIFLLFLLTVVVMIPFSGASVQVSDGASEEEVEELRYRVLELETQNARILEQLSRIQEFLETTVATEGTRTPGAQLESTGRLPASSVTRALEVAPETFLLSLLPLPQVQTPIVRAEGNESAIGQSFNTNTGREIDSRGG